jgi:class 3 adenylate cyclase
MDERLPRKLAAILYADVAGYSRLTGDDEDATHITLSEYLNLISQTIDSHRGKVMHYAGDAVLAKFEAVVDALSSATNIQQLLAEQNEALPDERKVYFRIGVNLGDVIEDRGDIYGDGVNVSARIQELAQPGGVCISGTVFEQVNGKVDHVFDDLGHQNVKNITKPIRVYAVRLSDTSSSRGHGPFFDKSTPKKPLTTGRCLCGEVRFEISAPSININFCHCRMCQRFTGGLMVAVAHFPREAVKFTRGEPKYYSGDPKYYKSSPIAERGFCGNCGSGLIYRGLTAQWLDWIVVHVSSLDNPEDFPPTWHLGVESQMPWADIYDDLPRVRCEDSPAIVEAWESVGVKGPWKGWEEES